MTAKADHEHLKRSALATKNARRIISDEELFHLDDIASEIRTLKGAETETVVRIGKNLNDAQGRLKSEKKFLAWAKFALPEFSIATIDNYKRAATLCENFQFVNFTNLTSSALYDLGRDSAPTEIVARIMERARTDRITHKQVKDMLKQGIPKKAKPSDKPNLEAEQLHELQADLSQYLAKYEHYSHLLVLVRERGIRLLLRDRRFDYDLVTVDEVLEPYDDTPVPWEITDAPSDDEPPTMH